MSQMSRKLIAFAGCVPLVVLVGGCIAETAEVAADKAEVAVDEEAYSDDVAEASEALCGASITSITYSPAPIRLGNTTSFTIYGSCLPETIAMWVADCANMTKNLWSPTKAQFSCTHTNNTYGWKAVHIKDRPGGNHIAPSPTSVYVNP